MFFRKWSWASGFIQLSWSTHLLIFCYSLAFFSSCVFFFFPCSPKTKIKQKIIKCRSWCVRIIQPDVWCHLSIVWGCSSNLCFRLGDDSHLLVTGSLVTRHLGLSSHRRSPVEWTAAASVTVPLFVQGDQNTKSRRPNSRTGLLGQTEPTQRQSQDALTWSQ